MHVHYVVRLKPEVRRLVEANFSSLKTKKYLVKAAVEAEIASGQEAQHIATIKAELAALHLSAGQSQFSGRGRAFTHGSRGAHGSSRGGAAGGPAVSPTSRRCPIA